MNMILSFAKEKIPGVRHIYYTVTTDDDISIVIRDDDTIKWMLEKIHDKRERKQNEQ